MSTQPTCADKLLLLHLSHVVPPQVRRGHALRVKTQAGALSEPLRQPGHVAVTLQVVGVQATGGERRRVGRGRGGGWGVCGDYRKERGREEVGGEQEEGEVQVQIDQSIVQTGTDERNPSPLGGVMCTKCSAVALTRS